MEISVSPNQLDRDFEVDMILLDKMWNGDGLSVCSAKARMGKIPETRNTQINRITSKVAEAMYCGFSKHNNIIIDYSNGIFTIQNKKISNSDEAIQLLYELQ